METYFDPLSSLSILHAFHICVFSFANFHICVIILDCQVAICAMQERDELSLMDSDTGCDFYPLGACM